MNLLEPLEEFREKWPAVFAGTNLDKMTEGGYCYRTLLNEKSRGDAPANIFLKSGSRKNLIIRDPFLRFWNAKIQRAA